MNAPENKENKGNAPENRWGKWHSPTLLFVLIITGALVWILPAHIGLIWTWIITIFLTYVLLTIASLGTNGKWLLGWLINEQNRMSLSRMQITLWTVVVFSAWVVAAITNLQIAERQDPLGVAIPSEIWIAMGISTTSLVGSGLILSGRPRVEAKQPSVEAGALARNATPGDANLGNLIQGEEKGSETVIDLTRVQSLFITLVLVGAYAVALGRAMAGTATQADMLGIREFPSLDESMIALLAISHAGYLTGKAIPKQPEPSGGTSSGSGSSQNRTRSQRRGRANASKLVVRDED